MNMVTQIETAPAIESAPTEKKPLCELCGCAIEDLEALVYLRAAELIERWEAADKRKSDPPRRPEPYRPAGSTVAAFWHVATHEPDKLKAWLARHPDDAPVLHKIWKAKRCS
jgi:hypothetical protein